MEGEIAVILMLTLLPALCVAGRDSHGKVVLSMHDQFTEEVKNRIRVSSENWPGNVESYAAYLTVNTTTDINLFFWFFKAKVEKRSTAPLLLWLNGGPGVSSLVGAMLENGPYQLREDGTVVERTHAWTNEFHMLYVDSPVGTGYSYSSQRFYEDDMEGVAKALYNLLHYMHGTMFPDCFQSGLYIGGQSYAGKYVPTLGKFIHDRNADQPVKNMRIPLKGVYIGGGFCDPKSMLPVHPDTLYYAGLISNKLREEFRADIMKVISKALEAGSISNQDLGVLFGVSDTATADGDFNSLLAPEVSIVQRELKLNELMSQEPIRQALHVGDANGTSYNFFSVAVAFKLLEKDFLDDTTDENKFLMENYKVLHYSGNLDMLVTVAMTDAFLNQVSWSGQTLYRHTRYTPWGTGGQFHGWYATVGNFTRVVVRNAGHHVPNDQPLAALEMMKSFVHGQPFGQFEQMAQSCA